MASSSVLYTSLFLLAKVISALTIKIFVAAINYDLAASAIVCVCPRAHLEK